MIAPCLSHEKMFSANRKEQEVACEKFCEDMKHLVGAMTTGRKPMTIGYSHIVSDIAISSEADPTRQLIPELFKMIRLSSGKAIRSAVIYPDSQNPENSQSKAHFVLSIVVFDAEDTE